MLTDNKWKEQVSHSDPEVAYYRKTDIAEKIFGAELRWQSAYREKETVYGEMNLELKKRIMKWYAAETQMLTQSDRRLEAFEMWIRRRMEKIRWLDKGTKKQALRRVNKERQVLNYIWQS